MLLREGLLAFAGLSAGLVIAAGVFAFLAIIGVFPRLIGKTGSGSHIMLFETVLILGGSLGNAEDLLEYPLGLGGAGEVLLGTCGLSVGIFVGCLVMSLAETLKALPVFTRRIRLSVGFPWVIASIALGKLAGSLIYFAERFGD